MGDPPRGKLAQVRQVLVVLVVDVVGRDLEEVADVHFAGELEKYAPPCCRGYFGDLAEQELMFGLGGGGGEGGGRGEG